MLFPQFIPPQSITIDWLWLFLIFKIKGLSGNKKIKMPKLFDLVLDLYK